MTFKLRKPVLVEIAKHKEMITRATEALETSIATMDRARLDAVQFLGELMEARQAIAMVLESAIDEAQSEFDEKSDQGFVVLVPHAR